MTTNIIKFCGFTKKELWQQNYCYPFPDPRGGKIDSARGRGLIPHLLFEVIITFDFKLFHFFPLTGGLGKNNSALPRHFLHDWMGLGTTEHHHRSRLLLHIFVFVLPCWVRIPSPRKRHLRRPQANTYHFSTFFLFSHSYYFPSCPAAICPLTITTMWL